MKPPIYSKSVLVNYLLLQLVALLAFSSCTKDLKLPASGQKKKIVLLGEMVAGDSITIRGAQSLTLSTSDTRFELPSGLSMSVNDGAGTVALSGELDILSDVIFSIPYKSQQRVAAGGNYTVTATHNVMGTATANVYVPAPFTAAILDTAHVVYNSAPAYRISINIEDKLNEENFYVIEALKQTVSITDIVFPDTPFPIIISDTSYSDQYVRQTIYSNDLASENMRSGTASRLNRRILFSDKNFSGPNFRTEVYIPTVNVLLDSLMTRPELHRTILLVKSVSKEYYNFLKSYEQYEPLSGFNTTGAPIRIEGNVQGGLGMVGGVYRRQFYFWIEQLL
jgi:hypothetical protein